MSSLAHHSFLHIHFQKKMRKTHYLHYSPEAGSNYYERSEKTEFIEAIVADTLSFSLLEATFSYADRHCKQFGPRSGQS